MINESEWEPTANLRYAVPGYTVAGSPTLQQEWRKATYDNNGHLSGWETEWRHIQRVVINR